MPATGDLAILAYYAHPDEGQAEHLQRPDEPHALRLSSSRRTSWPHQLTEEERDALAALPFALSGQQISN